MCGGDDIFFVNVFAAVSDLDGPFLSVSLSLLEKDGEDEEEGAQCDGGTDAFVTFDIIVVF